MEKEETKIKEKEKFIIGKPGLGFFLALCLFFAGARSAAAVPPPDFIFNIGSSVVQIFSFLAIGFSVVAGFAKRFFESSSFFVRHRRIAWAGVVAVIILLAYCGAVLISK